MLIVPNLVEISQWLDSLNVTYHQFDDENNQLHLSYLQKVNGVFDAKIILLDEMLTITVVAEVKQSAIAILVGELSDINQTALFVKVYLDIKDDQLAKIVFSYSIPVSNGITFDQFSLALARLEEEALQIIADLINCELLNQDEPSLYDTKPHALHLYH